MDWLQKRKTLQMNVNSLRKYIYKKDWGTLDFRPIKLDLLLKAQKEQKEFKPLSRKDYENNPIQVIDFFCGAGGTSLGFAAVNAVIPVFKFLGGCDINKISAETYAHNFDTPLINMDISDFVHEKEKLQRLLDDIGYDKRQPTILIGCAPCQGFTSHRKKHWNEDDDVRNNLITVFAKIVSSIKPEAFVMENVPEFLSKRYWKYFAAAKERYEREGYTVKENIYNAASFGVPQERFRSVIIGMKKEFLLPEGYLKPDEYRTVRDAIGKLPPVPAGVADPLDPMHKSASHKKTTLDVIRQVPHDGGNRPKGVGPACLDRTKGFSDTYGRLYWDRPSITITHYARNPASGRYIHPEQDRGLTAREASLLQSFPWNFEFLGKSDDIFRQIGEAVPPLFSVGIIVDMLIELVSIIPSKQELSEGVRSIVSPVSSSYSSVIAGIKTKRKGVSHD